MTGHRPAPDCFRLNPVTSQHPALSGEPPANAFEFRETIRWADSDPMGIVYYGAYLRVMGVGESDMFRSLGLTLDDMRLRRHIWLPRKALHLEFHSPAHLEEEILGRVWFSRVGRTSVTMRFEFYRASDLAHRASGSLTVVCVDHEKLRPTPLPDGIRDLLGRYSA